MAWEKKRKTVRDRAKVEFQGRVYNDVMMDIETMSTEDDAVVLSIGAVRFRMGNIDDKFSLEEPGRCFYARLDEHDQEDEHGRDVDNSPEGTMHWWSKQSSKARRVFKEESEPVETVLANFTQFCKGAKRIWGNGNTFDNKIIKNLYNDYEMDYPVDYWNDLDMRTLTWLWNYLTNWESKGKRPEVILGTAHNALDDAKMQVIQSQKMINQLKGSKYES